MTPSIALHEDKLLQLTNPSVVVIEGEGIGKEVVPAALQTIDAAVEKAYQGKRNIEWLPAGLGQTADGDVIIPPETWNLLDTYEIGLKGPLPTPIGKGARSLNVALRKRFDLYACVRPVKYFPGAPSPLKHPEGIDLTIFRENTEDVYRGIEFEIGSPQQWRLQRILIGEFGADLDTEVEYGLGIKPMSREGSARLLRHAFAHARKQGYPSVTIMHKGNINKFTEGMFRRVAYELAAREFSDFFVMEEDLYKNLHGKVPEGKILLNDRIADNMFQQLTLQPQRYGVIACPNLDGDYISDAAAALVGGLGISPGVNINYETGRAIFEATHGTAPDIAGKDLANPSSVMLSGAMMLDYFGWKEAGDLVRNGIAALIAQAGKQAEQREQLLSVTGDLARQYSGYTVRDGITCSDFTKRVIDFIEGK